MMSMFGGGMSIKLWQEMLPGDNGKLINPLLEKQYDLVYGSWPTEYNEIVLVLDDNNELDDMTLYALGLKSDSDIDAIMDAALNKTELDADIQKWSYEDICNMEFRTILGADCYSLDESTGLYTDLRNTDAGLRYLYDNGTVLKVSGIIRREDAVSTQLSGSIAYTHKLTEYVIEHNKESDAVIAQLENSSEDIFTGLPFKESTGSLTDAEKEQALRSYISGLDEKGKADVYVQIMSIPSDEQLSAAVAQAIDGMDRAAMEEALTQVMIEQWV